MDNWMEGRDARRTPAADMICKRQGFLKVCPSPSCGLVRVLVLAKCSGLLSMTRL